MTTPIWRCYGCEGPVPMCEDGPERWFEITEYREGEMQAVGAICENFPRCVRGLPRCESEVPPMEQLSPQDTQ